MMLWTRFQTQLDNCCWFGTYGDLIKEIHKRILCRNKANCALLSPMPLPVLCTPRGTRILFLVSLRSSRSFWPERDADKDPDVLQASQQGHRRLPDTPVMNVLRMFMSWFFNPSNRFHCHLPGCLVRRGPKKDGFGTGQFAWKKRVNF